MSVVTEVRKSFFMCCRCGVATVHSLYASENSDFKHCDADGYFQYHPTTFHLFKCDGCLQVSMYVCSGFHSPYKEFGERIYPYMIAQEPGIPDIVKKAYEDAEKVKQQSNSAYAILARKVLEAIAKERGVFHNNLACSISELVSKEEVPSVLAEAITLIRAFGNAGAHSSKTEINGLHVEMIEKFLEILIQYIYVAPSTLQQFKYLLDLEQPPEI